MIATTLAKAPKKYSAVLTGLLQNHKGGNLLTLDDMQNAMKEHWRIRNNLMKSSTFTYWVPSF